MIIIYSKFELSYIMCGSLWHIFSHKYSHDYYILLFGISIEMGLESEADIWYRINRVWLSDFHTIENFEPS